MKKFFKKNRMAKLGSAICNVGAIYFFTVAVRGGPASIVTGLYQSTMILAILAGIFILGEKNDIKRKLVGSVVTLIGVILLSFV